MLTISPCHTMTRRDEDAISPLKEHLTPLTIDTISTMHTINAIMSMTIGPRGACALMSSRQAKDRILTRHGVDQTEYSHPRGFVCHGVRALAASASVGHGAHGVGAASASVCPIA